MWNSPKIKVPSGRRRKTRWQKTKDDTRGFQWPRELVLAISAGFLGWLFLPEAQVMGQIAAVAIAAVSAAVIVPTVEFIWNFIRAPIRIFAEENVALRAQIEEYKTAEGIHEADIGGTIIKGRYYGKKFVLDDPLLAFEFTFDRHKGKILTILCPPNALGHFAFEMDAVEPFYVRPAGGDIAQKIFGETGTVEVRVNESSQIDIYPHESGGRIRFDLLAWTEVGE